MQWGRILLAIAAFVAPAAAAQFEFSTLIRWGGNGNPATNWELAVGDTPGVWSATGNATPGFSNNVDRLFQVDYVKATNTATLSLYGGATASGNPDVASFNPAGGTGMDPAANWLWRLPATSFFVQASPNLSASGISVQNLSLVTGSAVSPLQATALTSTQTLGLGGAVVNPGSDFIFVGDANGNWSLQGTVTMTAVGVTNANSMVFGLGANASDVPEPNPSLFIGIGLIFLAIRGRGRWTGRSTPV